MNKDKIVYPGVICTHCGNKYGHKQCGVATWYPGICGVCGADTYVTEPRDFGHLKKGWKNEEYIPRKVEDSRFPPR
jgi:hypothetical protein